MKLILYSKPDCHLCEGLQEKLAKVKSIPLEIEVRDITTSEDWFSAYQYEIPVLYCITPQGATLIPRFSPRSSVKQIEKILQTYS